MIKNCLDEKGKQALKKKIFKIPYGIRVWQLCRAIFLLREKSFSGFIEWTLKLRKHLDIPHKLSEVIEEKDFDINRLSKMALEDPSTGGNPKKLTVEDMKIMYEHSMSGNLF